MQLPPPPQRRVSATSARAGGCPFTGRAIPHPSPGPLAAQHHPSTEHYCFTPYFIIIIIIFKMKRFRHSGGTGLSAKAGLRGRPAGAGWEKGKVCRARRMLEGCRSAKPAEKKYCCSKSKPNLPQQEPPTRLLPAPSSQGTPQVKSAAGGKRRGRCS